MTKMTKLTGLWIKLQRAEWFVRPETLLRSLLEVLHSSNSAEGICGFHRALGRYPTPFCFTSKKHRSTTVSCHSSAAETWKKKAAASYVPTHLYSWTAVLPNPRFCNSSSPCTCKPGESPDFETLNAFHKRATSYRHPLYGTQSTSGHSLQTSFRACLR